jgi:hypothetical protein
MARTDRNIPTTTEDVFIQSLLGMYHAHGQDSTDFLEVHNALALRYGQTQVKHEYKTNIHEYRAETLQILRDFQDAYEDICERFDLRNRKFIKGNDFTYDNLLSAIKKHDPDLRGEKIREDFKAQQSAQQEEVSKLHKAFLRQKELWSPQDGRRRHPIPKQIIELSAKLHKQRSGKKPGSNDRKVIKDEPMAGESWFNIDYDIRLGLRGFDKLKGGLPEYFRVHSIFEDTPTTAEDVRTSINHYRKTHHGAWPDQRTKERINDQTRLHGRTWSAVDKDQTGGYSLYGHRLEMEKLFTEDNVLVSHLLHQHHTGRKRPDISKPEKIDDGTVLSGYSWIQINKMRIGGKTVPQIYKQYQENPKEHEYIRERVSDVLVQDKNGPTQGLDQYEIA